MKKALGFLVVAGIAVGAVFFWQKNIPLKTTDSTQFIATITGIRTMQPIPAQFAYCVPKGNEKSSQTGHNISPAVHWTAGPKGTKSYAVFMIDPDVPTVFTDAGKEGKILPATMQRQNFYHWAVINIPSNIRVIAENSGKSFKQGNMAVNDYLKFTGAKNTPENQQKYRGYDGPCPPWNDSRMHHYHFKVFALKTDKIALNEPFTGEQALNAITPYILASSTEVGTYTLNPALRKK
ncbi:MAG: YbhB/YbcL family Raf kinase inhibitor-like protein [Proteobacteria bacterium]|nr:YbhB/YbcL family Raf kinase inhibitor-like protein [Pseudomonadota bacterium]